jgi:hypothetical protein
VVGAVLDVDDGVGLHLAQGHQAELREGPRAMLVACRAEEGAVVGGVGHLPDGAIQGQQPPAPVGGARQGAGGADEAAEQGAQRADAQALAGVGEGGRVGLGLAGQRVELLPDVGQALVTPQGGGDDEIDDVMGGQAALPVAVPAGIVQDGEDELQGAEEVQRGNVVQGQQEVGQQRRP